MNFHTLNRNFRTQPDVHWCEQPFAIRHDKPARATLTDLTTKIAGELTASDDDHELKLIFNWYGETDFDTQSAAAKAALKNMLVHRFWAEIESELDPGNIEAMHKLTAEKAQEMREQGAAARARKTSLMQRVKAAYGNKDLLGLLEPQLEVEQIKQTMIDTISQDRLKHDHQISAEQSNELEMEIGQTEAAFRVCVQIACNNRLAPDFLLPKLMHEINQLPHDINGIQRDLAVFEEHGKFKAWLKIPVVAENNG